VSRRARSAVARRLPLVVLVALVALLPACGLHGLSFVQDDRVSIISPDDRAEVDLPLTVRWTVEDFDRKTGSFGVFVDRAPQPPGRTLAWLARDDEVCKATRGCPDAAYLAQHDAYRTRKTSFTVTEVQDLDRDNTQREFHEVTVVLLDDQGERIGESAFSVEFEVKGADS
jgi:hypothetical protein